MTFYRQKLLDAVRGLVGDGDLNLRLTHAAGHLIQMPMVAKGEMLPRDLEPSAARAAAQAVVDLFAAETGGP